MQDRYKYVFQKYRFSLLVFWADFFADLIILFLLCNMDESVGKMSALFFLDSIIFITYQCYILYIIAILLKGIYFSTSC